MQIDPSLFDVLACPACHAAFNTPAGDATSLVCSSCSASFPIVDGIPVLLNDQAQERS
ncbi:unannotated protein [freshwater metagenome]|uniref:Unannotated protein n=1 Tax=freshwater metagenome TaxID=449393 RepID=A0A6J7DJJ6_9ZZZZ|nr:Trm112 family protein [Actinomycetota bacterium]